MYGLRCINNLYSEHAGSRSDFIVVGHPEYNHGKTRSLSRGFGDAWDTRRVMHRPKNIAASRRFGTLVADLSSPEPLASLKERSQQRTLRAAAALEASGSEAAGAAGGALGASLRSSSSAPALRADFDTFLADLSAPEVPHISGKTARTPASFAGTKGYATVCRHFAARHGELDDLRRKLQTRPAETQRDLQRTGAWKYYATQLEQERRLQSQFTRERLRNEPAVQKFHAPAA